MKNRLLDLLESKADKTQEDSYGQEQSANWSNTPVAKMTATNMSFDELLTLEHCVASMSESTTVK